MSDEGWVTDKDALYTLIMLDGMQPGDEVTIDGDRRERDSGATAWDDALLRMEMDHHCTLLSAPYGPDLNRKHAYYFWPHTDKEMQVRLVKAWRRPCAKKT